MNWIYYIKRWFIEKRRHTRYKRTADELKTKGIDARVVSMPSFELFEAQSKEYKELVLPSKVRVRIAVEAATSFGWHKYVGIDGAVISIDHFGASGKADVLFEKFGFTVKNVVDTVSNLINKELLTV